jgi:uncharacterized protein (TIGR01244 family)
MTLRHQFKLAVHSLILLSFASSALAGNVPTEMEGLLNFHEVHPYLYRSGAPSEKSMSDVRNKGIKTIIDLRAGSEGAKDLSPQKEKALASELGMRYINLPMDSNPPTQKQVHTFVHAVEKAQKGNDPVLVHCTHGSDRTGCMVGIWRVTHENWNYDKTYQEMRKYFFTPKFTKLSGTVKQYADDQSSHVSASHESSSESTKSGSNGTDSKSSESPTSASKTSDSKSEIRTTESKVNN